MNITAALSILSTSLIMASCAGSIVTDPGDPVDHNVETHKQEYNTTRGGVQIIAIYYNQTQNRDSFGLAAPDEWIILKSDRKVDTKGWKLNAGDKSQDYPLPATINGRLYIFTHDSSNAPANVTTGGATMSLHRDPNTWIWNNSDHDTARLYDEKGVMVDSLTY